ncbi:hypothetical protein LWI28_006373 [Acer negundo]|uniref:Uncharacterized protein n=1 Tax=Acer negundo TaxID=4023 RepID=A0AAD5IM70_ACENE|nr:hypothetical protein LWI28_006373 [Acer negundo]
MAPKRRAAQSVEEANANRQHSSSTSSNIPRNLYLQPRATAIQDRRRRPFVSNRKPPHGAMNGSYQSKILFRFHTLSRSMAAGS